MLDEIDKPFSEWNAAEIRLACKFLRNRKRTLQKSRQQSFDYSSLSEVTKFTLGAAGVESMAGVRDQCHKVLRVIFRKWPLSAAMTLGYLREIDKIRSAHSMQLGIVREINTILRILNRAQKQIGLPMPQERKPAAKPALKTPRLG